MVASVSSAHSGLSLLPPLQGYQLRIAQLEQVVTKYEATTKQRFYAAPLALPTASQSSKRARVEKRSTSSRRRDDSDSEEEDEEDHSEEDASDVEEEPEPAPVVVDAAAAAAVRSSDITHSVGSTLSVPSVGAPVVAVQSGTNTAAVNVLATLASAATSSTTSTGTVGTPRLKVAKRISPRPLEADDGDSTPSTGSSGSRKRKLESATAPTTPNINLASLNTSDAPVATVVPSSAMVAVSGTSPAAATTMPLAIMPQAGAAPQAMYMRSGTSPIGSTSLAGPYGTMMPTLQQSAPAWYSPSMHSQVQAQQDMQKQFMHQQQKFMQMQPQPFFPSNYFPVGPAYQHSHMAPISSGLSPMPLQPNMSQTMNMHGMMSMPAGDYGTPSATGQPASGPFFFQPSTTQAFSGAAVSAAS